MGQFCSGPGWRTHRGAVVMDHYHLLQNRAGNLFGHSTRHCDPSGCAASTLMHLGDMRADNPPAVYLVDGGGPDGYCPALEEDLEPGFVIAIDRDAENHESSQEDVSSGPSGAERLNEEHRQAWAEKEGR